MMEPTDKNSAAQTVVFQVEALFHLQTDHLAFVGNFLDKYVNLYTVYDDRPVKRSTKGVHLSLPRKAQLYENDTPIGEVVVIGVPIGGHPSITILSLVAEGTVPELSFETNRYYLIMEYDESDEVL